MTNTADIAREADVPEEQIHPIYVRVTHWINAVAILVMIGSGWQIYNASPLFDFNFPAGSLGGWLAGGLLWHFAAMWLLIANGLVYLVLGLAGTEAEIAALARALKAACGAGGTVKDGVIELQGDHRASAQAALAERGLKSRI